MLSTFLLALILVTLFLVYLKLDAIFSKLTERDRARKKRVKDTLIRWDLEQKAWDRLSEDDKARFNDFHYEHAVGQIDDDQYEKMKQELSEKTDGLHSRQRKAKTASRCFR
jgi:hypothetical protein